MKRAAFVLFAMFAVMAVLLFPASQITFSQKTSTTVKVNCAKGESINTALSSNPKIQSLTIEISGMCHENVVVTRDRVTLRGADPANDGIRAVENTDLLDPTVWVRGAALFTIENLTLTGGFSGLLATNANLPFIQLRNCRLVGNSSFGIELENSVANGADTRFECGAGCIPAGAFLASRLSCNRCDFTSPGPMSVISIINSIALMSNSSFTGGAVRGEGSLISITDSTITSTSPGTPSVSAINANTVNLTRVEVFGRMIFGQRTSASLNGLVQTGIGMLPNEANFASTVIVGSAPQPMGGPPSIESYLAHFDVNAFSNLALNAGALIDGNLTCRTGSNAHCPNPAANVSGTTNCGLCPKP